MADAASQLPWTEEQWNRVRQVVYEEARGTRVVGSALPVYGPLGADVDYVARELLVAPEDVGVDDAAGIAVDDEDTLQLATLQTRVYLRDAQVTDPDLASALLAFRRAASVVARLEDDILLNGQAGPDEGPRPRVRLAGERPPPWEVRGGQESPGLAGDPRANRLPDPFPLPRGPMDVLGEALVGRISAAVGALEAGCHHGPFTCVLDQQFFNAVQTPNESLVLPQDRILPFLAGGALLRSSALDDWSGLVVALGGGPLDLAVGTDIAVELLQVTEHPLWVFRVYERIVLRVKEPTAIVTFRSETPNGVAVLGADGGGAADA